VNTEQINRACWIWGGTEVLTLANGPGVRWSGDTVKLRVAKNIAHLPFWKKNDGATPPL
jgi:hypothetical protein